MLRKICTLLIFLSTGAVTNGWGQKVVTLENALALALEHNFQIKLIKQDQIIAAMVNTYGNAGFLPTLDLQLARNFTVNNARQQFFSGDVREGNGVNSNVFQANVLLNWTVFDGMQMFVRKETFDNQVQRSDLAFKLQVQETMGQVAELYQTINFRKAQLDILENSLTIAQQRKKWAQDRLNIGVGNEPAVLQTQVDINADSVSIIRQKLEIQSLRIQLNEWLGGVLPADFETVTPENTLTPILDEQIKSKILEQNPSLQVIQKDLDLLRLQSKQARAPFLPSVSLQSSYNFNRSEAELGILQFNRNSGFTYGIGLNWNLFNGGQDNIRKQVAKVQEETGKLQYEQLELSIGTQIDQLLLEYRTNLELAAVERSNVRTAEANLQNLLGQARAGTVTEVAVREAQRNLNQAAFRQVETDFQLLRIDLVLRRLAGNW